MKTKLITTSASFLTHEWPLYPGGGRDEIEVELSDLKIDNSGTIPKTLSITRLSTNFKGFFHFCRSWRLRNYGS